MHLQAKRLIRKGVPRHVARHTITHSFNFAEKNKCRAICGILRLWSEDNPNGGFKDCCRHLYILNNRSLDGYSFELIKWCFERVRG